MPNKISDIILNAENPWGKKSNGEQPKSNGGTNGGPQQSSGGKASNGFGSKPRGPSQSDGNKEGFSSFGRGFGGNRFGGSQFGGGGGNFNDFQSTMRNKLPGGLGGSRGVVIVLLLVVSFWMASGFYRVQQGQVGIELVFGKLSGLPTQSGLNYNYPFPIGEVLTPEIERSRRIDIGYRGSIPDGSAETTQRITTIPEESLILTGDQNIVDLAFAVFWKINDPEAYLFNIRQPEQTIRIAAESAMREVVGQTNFDKAVTDGRAAIEGRALTVLQDLLDDYQSGVLVEKVDLQKSDPPPEVIDSFNDVQRARQDRDRLRNQAEAYANTIVPEARGQAEQIVRGAEAYRERLIREAEGEADRFLENLSAYETSPDATRRRMHIETMSEVFSRSNIILIDEGVTGIVPYLPLPAVQGLSKTTANAPTTESSPTPTNTQNQ
ncbi:MAG: FtsH protease activity modulator HflK [Alphaproteobacteria bacterium]|nr:FtsH protease activity modulator HflK [Alphaproteobacteria bacterium]